MMVWSFVSQPGSIYCYDVLLARLDARDFRLYA